MIFSKAPHGSAAGREGLDLLLLSASYDMPSAALFVGDGVYQLLANQQPELVGGKNYIATFRALPMYDVEQILICQDSLAQRGLTREQLILDVELCTPSQIADVIGQSTEVLRF